MTQRVELGGQATGPLSGVKIIDFTAVYSGPIASSILADQGAEVIKIESRHGDLMRIGLPKSNGLGSPFTVMNRNKKSLCLDLKSEEGIDIARKLIAGADVVMENFRPGVMDRLGLGYYQFKDAQPKLVYASINGVGSTGPYVKRPIYDAIIQAISGFTSLQSGEPAMVNSLVCDKITSLTAAQAITAALFQAERTGTGQRVELSMLDASLYFLWPDAMNNYTFPDESVESVPQLDHSIFMRKTLDGWIAAMPVQQKEAEASFRALDIEHLCDDERFASPEARARNRDEYVKITGEAYARFTTDEICQRLEEFDVPYSKINQREDVINDPQIIAMEALWTYDHPQAGEVRSPRPPAQFSVTPSNIRAHTPSLGEHNADILAAMGFDAEEIVKLKADGVIYAE